MQTGMVPIIKLLNERISDIRHDNRLDEKLKRDVLVELNAARAHLIDARSFLQNHQG